MDLSRSGLTRISFGSYVYMTITYLLPLIDCIGNRPFLVGVYLPCGNLLLVDGCVDVDLPVLVVLNVGC